MSCFVLSVPQAINLSGVEDIRNTLREFTCAKNPSIEQFARSSAVDFSLQGIAVTHLVYRKQVNPPLLGFFALTYKILRLRRGTLSRTSEKRLAKFAEYDAAADTFTLPAPLIAQLGKNDLPPGAAPFAGRELMALAEDKVRAIMRQVGGRAVYLECEEAPKLMAFYESLGFVRAARRHDRSGTDGSGRLYHIYVKFLNPSGAS